ncbi:hypothetical protein ES332_A09G197200v1 [Gossypium tomentosum]|uniref:Isoleucine--tRNA ligase n=1 Tax=Gossypium tomentosum TaxID=34277 RepID=A0A5D2P556_GOSTO|nr:hypothetical protein ES332_A09G197200v1 [Gossypium tomentosum]
MDLTFMETVWWVFAQLYEKGLVYKGFKVMPYSTGCKTPVSNFEASQNYKVYNAAFMAWTTTPWTLPSNLSLCVNANFVYVKVHNKYHGKIYVVAVKDVRGFTSGDKVCIHAYDNGTGIVHCAPAFGEDDYRVCIENQIINKGENLIVAVDDDGCLSGKITGFNGRFARVEQLKEQLIENNKQTYWIPEYVKGTPIPMWISKGGVEVIVMDSVEKLERLSGAKVFDLHRHNIDHITVPSTRGVLRRIDDVFDCWFASGSMPHAYIHYPFENVELFEKNFPGHFVAEGLDQTRGWFYTLMVLSIAFLGTPAFRNLICSGLVLAEEKEDDGMNFVSLIIVRTETLCFKMDGIFGVVKDVFLPWYNAYRFLVQNAKRLEYEGSALFVPIFLNWINSATQSLVHFVHQEMDAYWLYMVVPYPLKFLDNLTNIYISCKVMAPFTPFFTEVLYQNLRKVCAGAEESIHYCSFPQEEGKMVVVQPNEDFLDDIAGKLREVVLCEENFRGISNMSFKISLARPALVFKENAINGVAGNRKLAESLQVYLLSRDYYCLKLELEHGNGQEGEKKRATCVSCLHDAFIVGDKLNNTYYRNTTSLDLPT